MESRSKFTDFQKKDAFNLAQGLYQSKVLVQRPPTSAQKTTYNAVRSHNVPRMTHGSRMAKKRNKSKTPESIVQQANQSWRPFSGEKSLSKGKNKFVGMNINKQDSNSTSKIMPSNKQEIEDDDNSRLPKGVEMLDPWISEENFEEWIGIDADPNSFVILPCGFDNTIECLPPLQTSGEPLLQRPVKEFKKYVPPKILHNYNYLGNESSFQCQHDRRQTTKVDQSETVPRLRTSEIIRQEIEDLERLLQGYGNPNSSSIVNRYQYEITTLKEMVIETLRDYNLDEEVPEEKLEASLIQGDLFAFLERHEEVIAAIKEKRDACVRELAKLEQELREDSTSFAVPSRT